MLDRSLTYALISIAEAGIGAADALFVQRFGWNVRQLRVLRLVRSNAGITFTELARRTKFERSLTSRIVSGQIKAGLISRTGSRLDARVYALSITPAGEALCQEADPLTREFEKLMMAPLSKREQAALLSMLDRLKGWVQTGYVDEVAARYAADRPHKARDTTSRRKS